MNDSFVRVSVAALSLSAAGFVSLLLAESYSPNATIPVKGDVPTIGFGSTEGVKLGDKTTVEGALIRAARDVSKYEGALRQCIHVPLFQYEYDAYIHFSYNVGAKAFCNSTMAKKLNALDYKGACMEFDRWTYFQGKDCKTNRKLCGGLVTRRAAERDMCLGVKK